MPSGSDLVDLEGSFGNFEKSKVPIWFWILQPLNIYLGSSLLNKYKKNNLKKMDHDFVGSPSSRRSQQFLLVVSYESESISNTLLQNPLHALFRLKQKLIKKNPTSYPVPRLQPPKCFPDAPPNRLHFPTECFSRIPIFRHVTYSSHSNFCPRF